MAIVDDMNGEMCFGESGRGFRFITFDSNEPNASTKLACESSAIGDYPDAIESPGSSFLYIGEKHTLNREAVNLLRLSLEYWLAKGRLPQKQHLEELDKTHIVRIGETPVGLYLSQDVCGKLAKALDGLRIPWYEDENAGLLGIFLRDLKEVCEPPVPPEGSDGNQVCRPGE